MGSGIDLRKYQKPEAIQDIYSKIVSGKSGYKAIIERKKHLPKCAKCGKLGKDEEKFCPDCGGKMAPPLMNCPSCSKDLDGHEKFCTGCGAKLKD
jgi:membrane protease subunit (stomatin/prohibitin family)